MPQLPSNVNLYLVNSIDDVWNMKRWLGERRDCLGLDTETSGLNAFAPNARLRTIQIGDKYTGWTIPWERWGGAAIECLEAWEGDIALHNAPFDYHWLRRHAGYKLPWHRVHDTYVMAKVNEPHRPAGLKEVSDRYIDPRASEGEQRLKKAFKDYGWDWDTIPIDFPDYWVYGALDPVLAAHIKDHYKSDVMYPEVYDLEMAVLRICAEMSHKGMRVDLEYSQAKFNELTTKVEENKELALGKWGIAINSSDEVSEFLISQGAKFDIFTAKTKAPSVNKDQLEIFAKSDKVSDTVKEVAQLITETKKAEKMANTYFKNFLEMSENGLVHPSINTVNARTGRMSVTTPALQTVPRGDALVRDAFIPHAEGELLLSCDYSQIEMRLLAHFSRDDKLRESFKEADSTGGDFFVTLGKTIYNDPNFNKKDPRRGLVKSTLYGAAYGSGIQKMADTAGVSYEQMKAVSESVFMAFPGIKSFMQEVEKVGKFREANEGEGYILTQLGRRLPCDLDKVYALTNYMLQGTAAELMKKSIINLDAAGYTDLMRMPIHDEMIFSIPEKELEDTSKEIEIVMSYTHGEYSVDLPAEPEAGMDRWGNKYRKEGEIFGYDVEALIDA